MKKALALLLSYIATLVICVIVGEFVYMLYYNTTALIAGRPILFFSRQALVNGFFTVTPVVILFSGIILSCIRIRHPHGIFPFIMYCILAAATWGALYPAYLTFSLKVNHTVTVQEPAQPLTSGYFRRSGGTTYYLLSDLKKDSVEDIVIRNTDNPADSVSIGTAERDVIEKESAPFRDSLVRETISPAPHRLSLCVDLIELHAEQAWKGGWIRWLCFASLGFALFSSYALSFCSEWRLINILYLFIMQAGIISFNTLYYTVYFAGYRGKDQPLRLAAERFKYTGFFKYIDDPMLVCTNVLISVIFIIIGIIAVCARVRRSRRSGI